MGMAASQARLLSITSRMADNELRAQIVNNSKMRLATESAKVSEEYVSALNSSTMMMSNYDSIGNSQFQKLTYNALTQYSPHNNQYGLIDANGKILVSERESNIFKAADGDLNKYLESHGLEYGCSYFDRDTNTFGGNSVTLESPDEKTGEMFNLGSYSIDELKAMYEGGENTNHVGYDKALQSTQYANYTDLQNTFEAASKKLEQLIADDIEELYFGTNSLYKSTLNELQETDNPWDVYTKFLNGVFGTNIYDTSKSVGAPSNANQSVIQYIFDEDNSKWVNKDDNNGTIAYWRLQNGTDASGKSTFNQFIDSVLIDYDPKSTEKVKETEENTLVKSGGKVYMGEYTVTEDGKKVYEYVLEYQTGGWLVKFNPEFAEAMKETNEDGSESEYSRTYSGQYAALTTTGVFMSAKDQNTPPSFSATYTETFGDGTEYHHREYGPTSYTEYYDTRHYGGNKEWMKEALRSLVQEKLINFKNGLFSAIKEKYAETKYDADPTSAVGQAYKNYIDARSALIDFVYGEGKSEETNYTDNADNMLDPGWIIENSGSFPPGENFQNVKDIFVLDALFAKYGEPKWGWTDTTEAAVTGGNPDAKVDWYTNLFNRMKKGFKVIEDGLASSNEWIQFAFESGIVSMEQVDKNNNWTSLIYTSCSDITENTDELAITKAEAKYKRAMNDIENKDKRFDVELKNIDTEHNSLQTEYESVKSVIDKNIERTFKMYS